MDGPTPIPGSASAALGQSMVTLSSRFVDTITDPQAFREELARIRESGIAVNNEELAYGLRSIAAPIHSHSGEVVAALNLAVHRTMGSMEELIETYGVSPATYAKASAAFGKLMRRDAALQVSFAAAMR